MRNYVIHTERLQLRRFELDDAEFVLELVNEPGWLRYIGDKDVHSLVDARRYLQSGPLDLYRRHGFGLYLVERRIDDTPIGMCGLIKRDELECVDIGFAFLSRYTGHGYALEAATATLAHAGRLGITRLMAITTPDNESSQRVLKKIGMRFDRELQIGSTSLHAFVMDLHRGYEGVHVGV